MNPPADATLAARWLASGLMDVQFYGALRAREFGDPVEATEDFVAHGMSQRLSPHPFLDFVSLPPEIRRAWRRREVGQVLAHLTGDDGRVQPVGPLAAPADPVSARATLLDLATRLGRENVVGEDQDPALPDSSPHAGRPGLPGLTSVVVLAGDVRQTSQAVKGVLRHAEGLDVEVVVVDRGSPAHVALGLGAAFHLSPAVELVRVPGSTSVTPAVNLGLARARGEVVVVLQPRVQPRGDWLADVVDVMADPTVAGAQPVVLRPDDTIDSAGLVVLAEGAAPVPLLAGHQKEDARRLRGEPLAAISAEAMVLRAGDIAAVAGFDPRLSWAEAALALGARLLDRRTGGFRVAPTALVTVSGAADSHDARLPANPGIPEDPRLYERIGFTTEWRDPEGQGLAPAVVVTGVKAAGPDRLRWSLKLPSAPGPRGDRWGDTHFAEALAEALRGLGQDVVTCRRGVHASDTAHLDDVTLAVRGLEPVAPAAGKVNVLWVISHPEDVDPSEFEGYDLVFAASHPWSRALAARTGREVIPLLQATGFEPPPAAVAATGAEPGVVFVGAASPERERPLVWKAVEAGVPLAVYGPGWQSLPAGIWRGDYVDNRSLPELYHRHGIVLADHWPDMARHGFIANRVFDAVASGARVICDDVAGLHDVFDPRDVVVARTPQDIVAAVAELGRALPGEEVRRPALSFHDRARTLLDRVVPLSQSLTAGRGRR